MGTPKAFRMENSVMDNLEALLEAFPDQEESEMMVEILYFK